MVISTMLKSSVNQLGVTIMLFAHWGISNPWVIAALILIIGVVSIILVAISAGLLSWVAWYGLFLINQLVKVWKREAGFK